MLSQCILTDGYCILFLSLSTTSKYWGAYGGIDLKFPPRDPSLNCLWPFSSLSGTIFDSSKPMKCRVLKLMEHYCTDFTFFGWDFHVKWYVINIFIIYSVKIYLLTTFLSYTHILLSECMATEIYTVKLLLQSSTCTRNCDVIASMWLKNDNTVTSITDLAWWLSCQSRCSHHDASSYKWWLQPLDGFHRGLQETRFPPPGMSSVITTSLKSLWKCLKRFENILKNSHSCPFGVTG